MPILTKEFETQLPLAPPAPEDAERSTDRAGMGVILLAHSCFDSPFVVGSFHILEKLRQRPDVRVLGVEPFTGWRGGKRSRRDPLVLAPRLWLPLRVRSPWARELVLRADAALFCRELEPLIRRWPMERCVILDNPYAVDVAIWLKSRGFRMVLRLTDWMPGQIKSPDRETNFRMLRRALSSCDAVIATSAPVARYARHMSGRTCTVITNGVDSGFLGGAEGEQRADPRRVIYYGALDERVDVGALGRVAALLPGSIFDVYAPPGNLAGRGSLPPNVRFHGPIPYRDLPKVLPLYGFAVLPFRNCPANHGRFPMKLMEMIGCGVQVVAPPLGSLASGTPIPGLITCAAFGSDAIGVSLRKAQDEWEGLDSGRRRALLRAMRESAKGQTWDRKVDEILAVCRYRS